MAKLNSYNVQEWWRSRTRRRGEIRIRNSTSRPFNCPNKVLLLFWIAVDLWRSNEKEYGNFPSLEKDVKKFLKFQFNSIHSLVSSLWLNSILIVITIHPSTNGSTTLVQPLYSIIHLSIKKAQAKKGTHNNETKNLHLNEILAVGGEQGGEDRMARAVVWW